MSYTARFWITFLLFTTPLFVMGMLAVYTLHDVWESHFKVYRAEREDHKLYKIEVLGGDDEV